MSAPLVPSPLDYIGRRRFAFYPAIKDIEPNEWLLGTGTRSEVQVVNSSTGGEIWVPRQYIGAVSESGGPIVIVGLTKELKYRDGNLEPRVKRVIEMPQTVPETPKFKLFSARRAGPAHVVGIRIENKEDSPKNRVLATIGIGALLASLLGTLISVFART